MRHTIALAACLAATPCLAGGEPSPPYYPAPAPYYAPPYYAPWPNPIDVLVGGALAIPGVVLGGLFGAITPPVAVSCVGPRGSLSPPVPRRASTGLSRIPAGLRAGLRPHGACSAAFRLLRTPGPARAVQ